MHGETVKFEKKSVKTTFTLIEIMYPKDLINLHTFKFQQNCCDVISKFQIRVGVLVTPEHNKKQSNTFCISHLRITTYTNNKESVMNFKSI